MKHTLEEYNAAIFAITSSLHKSEKAILKLKEGTFQYRLLTQGIQSYHIALNLIDHEINQTKLDLYSLDDLLSAIEFYTTTIQRVLKVMPKFKEGTSQHTLGIRRINAFELAIVLLQKETNHVNHC